MVLLITWKAFFKKYNKTMMRFLSMDSLCTPHPKRDGLSPLSLRRRGAEKSLKNSNHWERTTHPGDPAWRELWVLVAALDSPLWPVRGIAVHVETWGCFLVQRKQSQALRGAQAWQSRTTSFINKAGEQSMHKSLQESHLHVSAALTLDPWKSNIPSCPTPQT